MTYNDLLNPSQPTFTTAPTTIECWCKMAGLASTRPAVVTVTPGSRSSHHVRHKSYRANPIRQDRQAE
jgi:hypothetical protein